MLVVVTPLTGRNHRSIPYTSLPRLSYSSRDDPKKKKKKKLFRRIRLRLFVELFLFLPLLLELLDGALAQRLAGLVFRGYASRVELRVQLRLREEHFLWRHPLSGLLFCRLTRLITQNKKQNKKRLSTSSDTYVPKTEKMKIPDFGAVSQIIQTDYLRTVLGALSVQYRYRSAFVIRPKKESLLMAQQNQHTDCVHVTATGIISNNHRDTADSRIPNKYRYTLLSDIKS